MVKENWNKIELFIQFDISLIFLFLWTEKKYWKIVKKGIDIMTIKFDTCPFSIFKFKSTKILQ